MSKLKKLATILEKRRELQVIQREIVAEMVQEVGEMTVVLFKASPQDPIWSRMPELESKLVELAKVSKIRKFKDAFFPQTATETSETDLPRLGCTPEKQPPGKKERPSFQTRGFVPDIPDDDL